LFLDEIGELSPTVQAKLLRVLQEKEFQRVGGTTTLKADVRLIAASNRNLASEVEAGRFREDLYYRLRVVEIEIPPLRERPEDLPLLVSRFLEQVAKRLGREKKPIGPAALARLARHPWPGNVRELRNVVEQAAVMASGDEITEQDLRLGAAPLLAGKALSPEHAATFADAKRLAVEQFERDYLLRALRQCGGNISRTAEAIGMVRQSLQQKIRELGLRDEDWRGEGEP
jgi:DNA-binding NtrC family response regulator